MPRALRTSLLAALVAGAAQAQPAPPAWAADAVWYQIFPERFANGDPTNDPTRASLEAPDAVGPDWTVTPWTADWYRRAPWEEARGPDFYADGVFDRRLGGDLQGVLDRVDYLDSLGVTAVYFNPIFHAASLHKYDASSYHHVDPHFGPDPAGDLARIAEETADPATWHWTSADRLFLRLVDSLHARGIRVVLDGVFNHTGTRFWAFADVARRQQDSPYAGWYEVTAWDDPATPESEFDWNGWWGYKPLAVLANRADGTDLHPEVKAHVFDVTRRWMDPDGDGDPSDGVDGWRLDVANEVPDGFWRDWTALVAEINPEAITVAEEWGDASDYLARTGFHAAMNYHALAIPLDAFAFDRRISAETFADEVTGRFAAYPAATRPALLNVLASHDTDRLASMIVNGGLGANYDREAGPRDTTGYAVRAPTAADRELQRAVVVLQVGLPGAPHVYYGDEAGMWGADDPDDRKPMVWPELEYEPEARDPLGRPRAPDSVAFDSTLYGFYQRAIELRRADPVLRRGELSVLAAEGPVVVFERVLGDERRLIAFNRSNEDYCISLGASRGGGQLTTVFSSSGRGGHVGDLGYVRYDDACQMSVAALSATIYRPAR